MNDLYIMHYGVGHDKGGHSGRYPWGSGKNPYGGQGTKDPTQATGYSSKARFTTMMFGGHGERLGRELSGNTGNPIYDLSRVNNIYEERKKNAEYNLQRIVNSYEEYDVSPEDMLNYDAVKKQIKNLRNILVQNKEDSIKKLTNFSKEWDLSKIMEPRSEIDEHGRRVKKTAYNSDANLYGAREFLKNYANEDYIKLDPNTMSDLDILKSALYS